MFNDHIICLDGTSRLHGTLEHLEFVRIIESTGNVDERQLHQVVVRFFLLLQGLVDYGAHVLVSDLIV